MPGAQTLLLSDMIASRKGGTPTYTITGTINDGDGAGLDGVTVTLSGDASDSTTTADGGAYSFSGLVNGSYTVTPSKDGSTFTPSSDNVTISGGNETATTMAEDNWLISGTIVDRAAANMEGVTVTLSGDASDSTTTAANGTYSFTGLLNGSYTVTPSKTETGITWTFSPSSTAVTVNNGNQTGKDFSGADLISVPFTLDFEDETAGQTPSWVTTQTGYKAPTVEANAVESLTKALEFAARDGGIETLGNGSINFSSGLGLRSAVGLPLVGGFRLQILEIRQSDAIQAFHIVDIADMATGDTDNNIYYRADEAAATNHLQLILTVDDDADDTGQQAQTSRSTGGSWRYTRWELTDDTSLTCKVYSTTGVQQGATFSVNWPAGGAIPTAVIPYMRFAAGTGYYWKIAQIWMGSISDDWPAM